MDLDLLLQLLVVLEVKPIRTVFNLLLFLPDTGLRLDDIGDVDEAAVLALYLPQGLGTLLVDGERTKVLREVIETV